MSEKRGFDAVVVGAGVVGLTIAWAAARRGASVAVLDRGRPPQGATRVAAGMLAPVGELSFGESQLLDMTLAAAAAYPEFIAALEAASGADTGYRRLGALHLALDRDEAAGLRRVHDLQRSLDLEAEWLAPRECRRLEPGLSPSLAGGVLAAGEAAVDPRALTASLLTALGGEGVEVIAETEVVAALGDEGRVTGVRTADGREIEAAATVLAGGAWSGRAAWLPPDARPPIRPVKGQILTLADPAGTPPTSHILASERIYLVPREDGRLVVGATVEERGFDTAVTAGGVHELLREAYRLLPDVAEMELVESTAALRPGSPDNLPLIGAAPGVEGLVWACGHYRNGILLAPLGAEAVAELLEGGTVSGPLAAADPRRPAVTALGAAR